MLDDKIGYLEKGDNIFSPKVNILNSDLLDSQDKDKILKRLQVWIYNKIKLLLKPINSNTNDISSFSSVRSIAYSLFNDFGYTDKNNSELFSNNLKDEEKKI